MPRSPARMFPAKPFMATSSTPASRTARSNPAASVSPGTEESNGHQASIAVNPAARAAAGRSVSGSSVNSMDMFASTRPHGAGGMDVPSGRRFRRSLEQSLDQLITHERIQTAKWLIQHD